ncbi:hypothetical protein IMZ48_33700 [Candidatus Bathyarchaeota archaeon]|nr:hypothetical protein [Candidatus Bathyarchaeota archaeon]
MPVVTGLNESPGTEVICSGEELSMVVRLASHPPSPHPSVWVAPSEAVTAVSVPPDDCAGSLDCGPAPVLLRHTSGVTVTYEVTAEGHDEAPGVYS